MHATLPLDRAEVTPISTSPRNSRQILAEMVLWIFLLQSMVRLPLLAFHYGTGFSTAIIHTITLIVFASVAGWALIRSSGRRAPQFFVALSIAACWLPWTIFDVDAFVSRQLGNTPFRFDDFAWLYCERKNWQNCALEYPGIIGSTALVLATWTAIIFMYADQLADLLRSAFARFSQSFPLPAPAGPIALAVIAGSYALAWAAAPSFMAEREPLGYLLGNAEFDGGPLELGYGKRPDFEIPPSPLVAPRTLVLITVDSLRSDAVELNPGRPSLTPFLRSLNRSGKLQDLGPATAICVSSFCGITGLLASRSWAGLEQGPPMTLADVLAANGYRNFFLLSGPHHSMRYLYGPNISVLLDDSDPDAHPIGDDRDQIRRLERLPIANPSKSFVNIHLLSPHPTGKRFTLPGGRQASRPPFGSTSSQYRERYYAGVAQADAVIERLFAILKKKGLLEDAIVVITADHGERLGTVTDSHGGDPDAQTLQIPLLIYQSRPTPWPRHALISQTDIAPTLLDAVRIAVPASWEGQSLLRPSRRLAAPIDGLRVTGMVARIEGKPALFRCNLETEATTVDTLDGSHASAAWHRIALRQAPTIHATLAKRKNGRRCFDVEDRAP